MTKRFGLVACLISLGLGALLPGTAVLAEDEDINTSVYLEFDPETGEFVTVEDPAGARQNHDPQDFAATPGGSETSPGSGGARQFSLAAGTVLALGLLGAAIAWYRKSRREPSA